MKTHFDANILDYCEILHDLNREIVILSGLRIYDTADMDFGFRKKEKLFITICQQLSLLIPCRSIDKEFQLEFNDGILSFSNICPFLEDSYTELFVEHKNFLQRIKCVRNKTLHSPHKLDIIGGSFENKGPAIVCKLDGNLMELYSSEFIPIIIKLNEIFDRLIEELKNYCSDLDINEDGYPFISLSIEKVFLLEYCRFNSILQSELLPNISKLMRDF